MHKPQDMDQDIQLKQGDAILKMQEHESNTFDLVVADPPYSSGGAVRSDRTQSTRTKYLSSDSENATKLPEFLGDNKDQRGYLAWSYLWMQEALRCLKDGGVFLVFTDWRQLPVTTDAVQAAGAVWRGIVPWYKTAARPMANRYTNQCEYIVWCTKGPRPVDMKDPDAKYPAGFYQYNPPPDRIHVTEKPVDLYRHLFQLCPDNGKILDPFLGSGNSAVAAHIEGRGLDFVGYELSPEVHALAEKMARQKLAQTRLC